MENARALTENLAALLRREHDALADFLVALADFDARRVWAELGHTSLFWFLHRELGLSKGAAFYRKTAAELVQQFPEVVAPFGMGDSACPASPRSRRSSRLRTGARCCPGSSTGPSPRPSRSPPS